MPVALEAAVTATQRVRSERTASIAEAGSASVSRSGSAQRTVAPARSAAITHGRTFASWSRRVTTTSSPGPSVRPTAAESRIVIAVIDGPKATPAGSAPSSRATAARARSTHSSVACAAAKTPPWFALRPERMNVGHRLDRGVHHLRARRPVQPRPAPGQPGEAVAVHSRSRAARTSSTSCG